MAVYEELAKMEMEIEAFFGFFVTCNVLWIVVFGPRNTDGTSLNRTGVEFSHSSYLF